MSSKCNLIVREERNIKKELILYRHDDGHPSIMVDSISQMLYEIYHEYEKFGDIDWFLDPSKVASKLIIKSIFRMPSSLQSILPQLDDITRRKFELYTNLETPTIVPDIHRTPNCNYEYIITLKEVIDPELFRGYTLDVVKLSNNKKVQDVLSLNINLGSSTPVEVVSHESYE